MSRPYFLALAISVVVAGLCVGLFGQAANRTASEKQAERQKESDAIVQMLDSGEASKITIAIERIKLGLESNSVWAVSQLRTKWLKPLFNAKQYDVVEDLAIKGILAQPSLTTEVEGLQELRVRVALEQGNIAGALPMAKSLFNVATMRGTEKALLLVSECLRRADHADLMEKFQKEQIAGAATQPANSHTTLTSKVLADVTIDGKVYQDRIDELSSDDDRTLLGMGNLLLLADRPKEAYAIFDKLLNTTSSVKHVPFHENIARAIKSEDGTIGRANAYARAAPEDESTAIPFP